MQRLFWLAIAAPLYSAPTLPPEVSSFVQKNCIACHKGEKSPAGIDLSRLDFNLSDKETYSRWVRVHDAVDKQSMPPGAPKSLPLEARATFTKTLAEPLEVFARDRAQNQGRSTLRRLNRYEYENTVRDLLGAPWLLLKDSLPEDGILARFNKSGEALDVSHVQMARYLETAETAIRATLQAQATKQAKQRFYARDQRRFLNRMRFSPFNTSPERGMIPIFGFEAQRDVLSDSVPISMGPDFPELRDLEGFATPASTYNGNDYSWDQFVAKSGGKYKIRLNAFSIWIGTEWAPLGRKDRPPYWRPSRQHTEKGRNNEPLSLYALRPGGERRYLTTIDLTPEPTAHEVEVYLLAGDSIAPDAARLFRSRPGWVGSPQASAEGTPGVAYRWMEVEGPGNPTIPNLIPSTKAQAPDYLKNFLARAYRRPYTPTEYQTFERILNAKLDKNLTDAMVDAYTAVLCSPGFLYLEEKPGPLIATALASRLSYFLWNAAPDTELRRLGANGDLANPEVLRAQTERLLKDPRSKQFFQAFLDYWLDLRKLNENTPDVTLYPDYYLDDLLTESAEAQTRLYFAHLVEHNLPAKNIAQSDFTYLNAKLAEHYGIEGVSGWQLRKVDLKDHTLRGGFLTNASILKITANGTTTSPVIRGTWIMERIVGQPPPPPPPGVGAVEPDTRGATTIREQLAKHRANASCNACHKNIDPPGFALEAFDLMGAQRTHYRSLEEGDPVLGLGKNGHAFTFKLGKPVDASGEFQGQAFQGIEDFQTILAKNDRQLARNFASQLIVYATGAPAGFAGRKGLEDILDQSAASQYGLRTIIHQIIQSDFFRNK